MERAMLPPSMMVTGIIGFIISAIYTAGGSFTELFDNTLGWGENFGVSIGFAFCLVFLLIIIASFVSMTPTDKEFS